MDELVKSLPEIIKQSATSPLGILALMIIGLAILAFFFFRGASERARIVIFVMLFFGVAAFGAVVLHQVGKSRQSEVAHPANVSPAQEEKKPLALRASIWKVELDSKGTQLGSKEFSAGSGHVSETSLREFAEWVSNQLELTARKGAPKVHLKVEIPADLTSEKPMLQRIPDGKMDVLLWDERGSVKGRTPLTWEALKEMQTPFQLEVRIPGSAPTVIEATPGTALTKEMDLEPLKVRIGVEKFSGPEDGITDRICNELSANPLIDIVNPDMLDNVRKEIEKQRETIRLHPQMQVAVRSLGIDYIISGSVQAKTP
jgi:hypothetical protein